jgi:hypothetical protein
MNRMIVDRDFARDVLLECLRSWLRLQNAAYMLAQMHADAGFRRWCSTQPPMTDAEKEMVYRTWLAW